MSQLDNLKSIIQKGLGKEEIIFDNKMEESAKEQRKKCEIEVMRNNEEKKEKIGKSKDLLRELELKMRKTLGK